MTTKLIFSGLLAGLAFCASAGIYGDTPDAKHAWAVHDWNRPKPHRVTPGADLGRPPSDAIVLFDGSRASFEKNWRDANGGVSQWKLSDEGYFYTVPGWKNGGGIFTRAEFGDCQLHLEYRHDPDQLYADKGPQMRGNSGVFLMGPETGYEVQVLESYHTSAEDNSVDNYTDGQAGAVYAENPPMVNPARPAGEWQVYDIVFHQPIFDGLKVVRPGSVTVFFNGVLVQDHWELEGSTTHQKRRPLVPHAEKGPLFLQDHGCVVQFRNIWIRPIPSRWANRTHSLLSADENEVRKCRRETAARLFAALPDKEALTLENALALAEVVSYAKEGEWDRQWKKVAKAVALEFEKKGDDELKARKDEIVAARTKLEVLIRNGVLNTNCTLWYQLRRVSKQFGWME